MLPRFFVPAGFALVVFRASSVLALLGLASGRYHLTGADGQSLDGQRAPALIAWEIACTLWVALGVAGLFAACLRCMRGRADGPAMLRLWAAAQLFAAALGAFAFAVEWKLAPAALGATWLATWGDVACCCMPLTLVFAATVVGQSIVADPRARPYSNQTSTS